MLTEKSRQGFTIVELLVVIVVIAILAAITIVVYNGIQDRARASTIQAGLRNAASAMGLATVDGATPTQLPATVTAPQGAYLSLSEEQNGYCINAESLLKPATGYSFSSISGTIQNKLCSGKVIQNSEVGRSPNLLTAPDFSSSWGLNFQNGTGRALSTRTGTSDDPYIDRPVLILSNSSTASTGWSVIQSSGINRAAIVAGKTYEMSYWVRSIGPYNATTAEYGFMTGGAQNQTISLGANITTTSSWQRIRQQKVASQNMPSDNVLYLYLNTSAFTRTGWSLEFQGFDTREL